MEFDHLLRKYLSGTMSEQELEHFQSLLDRVPEYKTELRQVLELRSLLHDDALTLTPPADLSEHIRIAVSSSFAADAIAEWEEESRRRRVYLHPLGISLGALVATCLAVGVALTPTLPTQRANMADAGVGASKVISVAPDAHGKLTPPTLSPNALAHAHMTKPDALSVVPASTAAGTSPATDASIADAAINSQLNNGIGEDMAMLGHELPYRSSIDAGTNSGGNIAFNANDGTAHSIGSQMLSSERSTLLSRDPADLLRRDGMQPSYNPQLDGGMHREAQPVAHAPAQPGETIAMAGDKGRSLTFGVTIGSGSVADKDASPTALLQNSYYFSFGLSGSDRIGIEMGASTFRRDNDGSTSFAKLTPNDAGLVFASTGTNQGYAGLVSDGSSSTYLGKRSLVDPGPDDNLPTKDLPTPKSGDDLKNTRSSGGSGSGSSGSSNHNDAAKPSLKPITYGAVFYDRRIKLSTSWDLCGRVTVGGADNGVLTNVRAYAAFSPGAKNVTLTMGVGGSALYNFNAKNQSSSGNFGVYYGIETGF